MYVTVTIILTVSLSNFGPDDANSSGFFSLGIFKIAASVVQELDHICHHGNMPLYMVKPTSTNVEIVYHNDFSLTTDSKETSIELSSEL